MSLLFEAIPGQTIFHRMDERLFFLSYLLFQLLLVSVPGALLLPLLALLLLLLHSIGSGVRPFLQAAKGFLLFLLFLALFSVGAVLISGGNPTGQLIYSAALLIRLLTLVMSAHLMLGILSPLGVSAVLRWATAPLGKPGRTFSLILVAFFALLPRLEKRLRDQREARLLRSTGVSGALRKVRYTLYPLLREGALEAERLTDAFIIRGYLSQNGAPMIPFKKGRGDWLLPLGLLVLLLFFVFAPMEAYWG